MESKRSDSLRSVFLGVVLSLLLLAGGLLLTPEPALAGDEVQTTIQADLANTLTDNASTITKASDDLVVTNIHRTSVSDESDGVCRSCPMPDTGDKARRLFAIVGGLVILGAVLVGLGIRSSRKRDPKVGRHSA